MREGDSLSRVSLSREPNMHQRVVMMKGGPLMKWSYTTKLAASIAIAAAMIGGVMSGVTARAQPAPAVVAIPNPPMSSLDPTQWGGQILIDQGTVMEGLYGYNDKNQIVPKIATGYKESGGGKD